MWIFAPGGLLMPSTFPADKVEPGYLDAEGTFDLQIRVRAVSHLENFIRDYLTPMGLKHSDIQRTPHMDYNARIYMSRQDFATALSAMVLDIDYQKFKPTAERRNEDGSLMYGADSGTYHSVLNSIWGSVCRLGSPGGWWGPKSSSNPAGYTSRDRSLGGGAYTDWWASRGKKDRDDVGLGDDLFPETRSFGRELADAEGNWWDDPEFGTGSLKDQIGADLDDGYTPDEEERRHDILLTVDGIPADQWDEFLTHEEFVLVKDAHAKALAEMKTEKRAEKRRSIIGRRRNREARHKV